MKKDKKLSMVMEKAVNHINKGNWDSAISTLQKYCKKKPRDASIPLNIGLFFQSNNMPIKAEMFYSESLKINANQPVILFNLGVIYQNLNQIDSAINAYLKAIKLDPNYSKCYANLGYVYNEAGDQENSLKYSKKALELDPQNPQIQHMVASLNVIETPDTANEDYIKNVFNGYAKDYDKHLIEGLKFKTPQLIFEITEPYLSRDNEIDIVDLGCGTGLCAELFTKFTRRIIGIDLSEGMIDKARDKNIYSDLYIGEINDLIRNFQAKFELALCSDVLIYIGKLDQLFVDIYKSLKAGGMFSFSIEKLSNDKNPGEDYLLDTTGRYKHSHEYIKSISAKAGFKVIQSEDVVLRKQDNKDVRGTVYILKT